jgi:hypothetical protein
LAGFSQKNEIQKEIETWRNAVVNIETQGYNMQLYKIDSILTMRKKMGYSKLLSDPLNDTLSTGTMHTGTAIYVIDNNKKYLITVKHLLLDSSIVKQKIYETKNGIHNWQGNMDGITNTIAIRTPINYFNKNKGLFNFSIANNQVDNVNQLPYIFFPDSLGDIAIISLQEKSYKYLDTVLQRAGYKPLSLEKILTSNNIEDGDNVTSVGFPENVSIVAAFTFPSSIKVVQASVIVAPFITFGKVSMTDTSLKFFYADITTGRGCSGAPIIKDNKLIGIVSATDNYNIISDDDFSFLKGHLQGIGHLTKAIKVTNLLEHLRILQARGKQPDFFIVVQCRISSIALRSLLTSA